MLNERKRLWYALTLQAGLCRWFVYQIIFPPTMHGKWTHPILDKNSILMGKSPICAKLGQSDTQCCIGIQSSTCLEDAQTVLPTDSRHRTVALWVSIH